MVSPGARAVVPDEGPGSAADRYATGLGVRVLSWGDGCAVAELTIAPQHLNALGIAHGGAVFGLSDATLALAANRPGEPAVAVGTRIQFLRASHPGDQLVATAREEHRGGRLAIYRIEVRRDDDLIAIAMGEAMPVSTPPKGQS